MNDNDKKLSEFTDILKWQIDMGADAMVEEGMENLNCLKATHSTAT